MLKLVHRGRRFGNLIKITPGNYSVEDDMTTTTTRSPESRVWSFLPLIVPGVIITSFMAFYQGFLMCFEQDGKCSPLTSELLAAAMSRTDQTRILTYVAKAAWTLVDGVHLLACLAALVTSALIIYHALLDYHPRFRRTIIIVAFALTADLSLLFTLWANRDIGAPAPELLRTTVATDFPRILFYTHVSDAMSLTAALSLCFAATAILWKRYANQPDDATDLARRMKLLRYVLYMGAVLLVMGVLRLSTTLNWAASFLQVQSEAGKGIASLVTGVVSSLGTYYTLLMSGIYLPAALVLRARARELAELQPQEEQQTWLTKRGLTLSYAESLPRLVAILAPLMAGPFVDIIKRLVGSPGG